MARAVILLLTWLIWEPLSIEAGVVQSLGNNPAQSGKLSLSATSIHVEGTATGDVKFSDLLEADFADEPFHVSYFDSAGDVGNQLPMGWTAKAIGPADPAGSASYAAGALTLTGDGCGVQDAQPDHYYFAGLPWTGDGQWTAYFGDVQGEAGFTLRSSLDPGSGMFGAGINGFIHYGAGYKGFPGSSPTWLRMTKTGSSVVSSISTDGKTWQIASQDIIDPSYSWFGVMLNSRQDKVTGKAVINHMTFTPGEPQPETVPNGMLFRSGSFLAGNTFYLSPTGGAFTYNNKSIAVTPDQVAAVIYHPVTQHDLSAVSDQPGLILKNGDFLASDVQLLQGGMVQMSSIALGIVGYYPDLVRACEINPLRPLPSDYEVRLRDGSTIRAKSLELTNGTLTIQEIGGITVTVDPSQVAQLRAGLTQVQPLISLPWIARTAATKPSAAAESVSRWAGPNQEQILVIPAGETVDFPLKGKFQALAMRLALAPGAPPNAQATLRVLDGGKEVTRTPMIKAGDEPQFVRLMTTDLKSLSLEVDSTQAGTRLMLIDPVAIRSH